MSDYCVTEEEVLNTQFNAADRALCVELERGRPFMLLYPKMFKDGEKWCALYGENLDDGVAGFGDTPDEASRAFDEVWKGE